MSRFAAGRPNGERDWCSSPRFAGLLAVLLVAWFPDVVFGGRSFFYRDFGVLAYPTIHYVRESFWRGEWPLWNPLSHCGVPFLAQWGPMVLYPGSLCYLLLPLPWSLNFFCLAHLWWGGLGMYHLARRWTAHSPAAALAGVAFTFNGVTQSCLLWPNYTVALGWMPWVVLLVERAQANGRRTVVVAAVVAAMQLLAGVPEIVGMTWLALAAFWLGRGGVAHPSGDSARETSPHPASLPLVTGRGEAAIRSALVALLALGLAAAQLLPFADLLVHSQRAGGIALEKWALPLWGMGNFVVPLFHCYQNVNGLFFQPGQEFFSSVYLGGGLLAFALLAVALVRERRVWVLAGLAGLGVALAFGEASSVYRGWGAIFPPASLARYPVKWLLLAAFSAPLLAAFGLRALLTGPGLEASSRRRHTFRVLGGMALGVVGAIAIITGLAVLQPLATDQPQVTVLNAVTRLAFLLAMVAVVAGARARRGMGWKPWCVLVLLGSLWGDYRTHTPRQNPSLPSRLLAPNLAGQGLPGAGQGRVFIPGDAEEQLRRSRVADAEADFAGKRLAQWSNLNLLDRVAKVNGALTLRLRESDRIQQWLVASNWPPGEALLDFVGASHRPSPANVTAWERRATARPLVTAGQAPVFVTDEATRAALTASTFDPAAKVLVPVATASALAAVRAASAGVSDLVWTPHRITFAVTSPAPTLAVVAQSFHPNWRATVNGVPTEVFRANAAFQALAVPAGQSRIELRYVDRAWRLGALVSVATMVLCGGLWWRGGQPGGTA